MLKKVNKKNIKILSAMLFIVVISNINAFAMKNDEKDYANLNINEEIKLKKEKNEETKYDYSSNENNEMDYYENLNINNEITFNNNDTKLNNDFNNFCEDVSSKNTNNDDYESFCDEYVTYTKIDTDYVYKKTETTKKLEEKKSKEIKKTEKPILLIQEEIEKPKRLVKTEISKKQSIKKNEKPKTEMADNKKNSIDILNKILEDYKYYENILNKRLATYTYYYKKFKDSKILEKIDNIDKKISKFENIIASIIENSRKKIKIINVESAKNINNFQDILNFAENFKYTKNIETAKEDLEIIVEILQQIYNEVGSKETFAEYNELSKVRYINDSEEYYGLCVDFYNDTNTSIENENDENTKSIENNNNQEEEYKTENIIKLENEINKIKNEIMNIIKQNNEILEKLSNKFNKINEEYMNQELIKNISKTKDEIKTNNFQNNIQEKSNYDDYEYDNYEYDDYEYDDSENNASDSSY